MEYAIVAGYVVIGVGIISIYFYKAYTEVQVAMAELEILLANFIAGSIKEEEYKKKRKLVLNNFSRVQRWIYKHMKVKSL